MAFDPRIRHVDVVLSPAQVGSFTVVEQQFTVPGARSDDAVIHVRKPTAQTGMSVTQGRVVSEGTVGVSFLNATGAPITPTASETYTFVLFVRQP